MSNASETCELCNSNGLTVVYSGPVRDGVFGAVCENAVVTECPQCGVQRLGEQWCLPDSHYETPEYREKLKQGITSNDYFKMHDGLQINALEALDLPTLRNATLADIGCAGGSFLDHVKGLAKACIAVEPFVDFHPDLRDRGYAVHPYATDASQYHAGQVDAAFSFQVIEHTQDPVLFLKGIAPLLKPNGTLTISTPNRRDILMDLLPDDFPRFFYRVVHRWYFDAISLSRCAHMAGFDVIATHHVHRYTMANALRWLRDRRPTGNGSMVGISKAEDLSWRGAREQSGTSDCLFMVLKPRGSA